MPTAVIIPLVHPPFAQKGSSKPFAKIDNREIFLRVVEMYASREHVVQKLLAITPDDLALIQSKYVAHLGFQGVSVATGGSDWFSCVGRAIEKLKPEIDTVIVHDGACPAVPYTLLDALDDAITKTDAVVPVLPTRSAFADAEGKALKEYVDMTAVQEIQSPQAFKRAVLQEAYAKRNGQTFMDDGELVLMTLGRRITTIAGSRLNQRMDSEEILKLGKDLIAHLPRPKSKTPLTPFDEAQW